MTTVSEADIILAKHRGGPIDTIQVAHQLHYSSSSTWHMANSLPHPQNRQPVSHIRGLAISGAFAAAVMALSLSGVGCSGTPAPEGGTGQPTSAPVMPTKPSPQVNAQKFVYGHQHPRQHGYLVTPKKLSPAKRSL